MTQNQASVTRKSFTEQIERLKLMALGTDDTWDLSDNDCAAIKALLDSHEQTTQQLQSREKHLHQACVNQGCQFSELRDALAQKQRGMTFVESERNSELVRQVQQLQADKERAYQAMKSFRTYLHTSDCRCSPCELYKEWDAARGVQAKEGTDGIEG